MKPVKLRIETYLACIDPLIDFLQSEGYKVETDCKGTSTVFHLTITKDDPPKSKLKPMQLHRVRLDHARNTHPFFRGAKVLSVANMDGSIYLFYESPDGASGVEERTFIVKCNGEYVTDEPNRQFIGTVMTHRCDCGTDTSGPTDQVNHVYEVL